MLPLSEVLSGKMGLCRLILEPSSEGDDSYVLVAVYAYLSIYFNREPLLEAVEYKFAFSTKFD
mgnify:FL=1